MTEGSHTIKYGDTVILERPITVRDTVIFAGESGFVIDVDPETGGMVVQLDRHHSSLQSDRNLIDVGPQDVRRVGFA
jgi:hypothetical protein